MKGIQLLKKIIFQFIVIIPFYSLCKPKKKMIMSNDYKKNTQKVFE